MVKRLPARVPFQRHAPELLFVTMVAMVASKTVAFARPALLCGRSVSYCGVPWQKRFLAPSPSVQPPGLRAADDNTDFPQEERHTITWKTRPKVELGNNITEEQNNNATSIQFYAQDGETLRTASLRRGLASPHNGHANVINCRGLGTCGTCAVEITNMNAENNVEPPQRNAIENLRLSLPPHNLMTSSSKDEENSHPNIRLACQVQVRGDVTIVKKAGFWGQRRDEIVEEVSEPTQPFGDLEFLLDDKSPPPQ